MKSLIKYLFPTLLSGVVLAGCSDEGQFGVEETDNITIQAVNATVDNRESTARSSDNPTQMGFADRYAAGQNLYITIAGQTGVYKFENSQWRPIRQGAVFPAGEQSRVEAIIRTEETVNYQDGSAVGMSNADPLTFSGVKDAGWIIDLHFLHVNSLMEMEFDVDVETTVMVNGDELAYRVPGTNKFLYVVTPGTTSLELTYYANNWTENKITVPIAGGVVANQIYTVPLVSGVDPILLVVGPITVRPWSDLGEGGAGRDAEYNEPPLTETTHFRVEGFENADDVIVKYANGILKSLTFDAAGEATLPSSDSRTIASLIRNGVEVPLGVIEGGSIALKVNSNSVVQPRTDASGNILVGSVAEFRMAMRMSVTANNQTFLQQNALDFSGVTYTPAPFGSTSYATNIYDGGKNEIRNLIIEANNPALISVLYGNVRNIIMASGEITGGGYAGSLVSEFQRGRIDSCANYIPIVNTDGSGAGGLVGRTLGAQNKYIYASFNAAPVSGTTRVGGILGEANGSNYVYSSMQYCYNTGEIIGDNIVGGLLGYDAVAYLYTQVLYSYNTGKVTSEGAWGGVIGSFVSTYLYTWATNVFYTNSKAYGMTATLAYGNSSRQFSSGSDGWPTASLAGWDPATTPWASLGSYGRGYPRLDWED